MTTYLEHVNLSVSNLDKSIQFFQTAFPEFKVRGGGDGDHGKWVHIGTNETYIAINEAGEPNTSKRYHHGGFNHVGFVVEDVSQLAERLLEAGYRRSYPLQQQQYRIRDYFLDDEGNEYEFVEYLSEKPEERNDYND